MLTEQNVSIYSNFGVFHSPDKEFNIYPYKNLDWFNYVERFKFKFPETIITKADGKSVCNDCKQLYVGYQEKCVRPRYGYETGWHNYVTIGNKMVGEEGNGYGGRVNKSGIYPCGHYCTWDQISEFNNQNYAFNELNMVIEKMCGVHFLSHVTLDENDAEKWALVQKMDMLKMENESIKSALKEVVNHLNQGGAGLMGHIGNL